MATNKYVKDGVCGGCKGKDGVHVEGCRAVTPPRGLNPNPCACYVCDRTVGPGGHAWEQDGLKTYAHQKCYNQDCD